jgi:hypothetical protein
MHLSTGRGTTDNVSILRQIIEKAYECNINLHVLFVDFKQVFDSVKRIKTYEILKQRDMPANFVILIKMTIEHSDGRIILKSNLSEKFSTFK